MLEDRKWQFNECFLNSVIGIGNKLLSNKETEKETKIKIIKTIKTCEELLSVLNGTYMEEEQSEEFKGFNSTKKCLLEKMQLDFQEIDHNIMNFICDLNDISSIFYSCYEKYNECNSIEDIITNTLGVYESFAPELLSSAKKIIYSDFCVINFSNKYHIGSQCIYDRFINTSFIEIEQYNKRPMTFIYELEHAIENANSYDFGKFYSEVGAITFETLYIDNMCERKENNAELLYFRRLSNFSFKLDYLSSYFKALQSLSKYNFDVNKSQFLDILRSSNLIIKDRIPLFMLKKNTKEYLLYFLSFLKSIEIRNNFHDDRKYGLKLLKKLATESNSMFSDSFLLTLLNLENYQNEVKVKRLRRNYK